MENKGQDDNQKKEKRTNVRIPAICLILALIAIVVGLMTYYNMPSAKVRKQLDLGITCEKHI